ncbi:putative chemotaxis protein ched [Acanthamoeba polyphaga mimivirus]|uniref:Chemotaxis protein ched n=1 Tax=Acanthamoeba polyphaga mimivirus Kroon TaxID=3069720 RepID=A0A0G2YBJ1_9VIRU|nr:putative chemotaxis protein ched [Acanthamoeba polyphaga mimivirus]AKI80461.1 putative chemotaxis protein ched [Acanthamoeba polyphaga mimivirus Kroon]
MYTSTKPDKQNKLKKLIYNEKYHDNCHDYLKTTYLEKYAEPRYKKLLYKIREKIPKVDICEDTVFDDYRNVIVCDQHAVIFGHYNDVFPILATYALNACIGLVMYVPKHKIGALAHIDGLPGYSQESAKEDGLELDFSPVYENIEIMIRYLKQLSGSNESLEITYYLIGGIYGLSEVMIHDILETINKIQNDKLKFNFMGRNLLGPGNQSRNICIDMETGKITYFDYTINSEYYGKNRKDNVPMNIIRAPRKSEAYLDITYVPISIDDSQ